MKITINNKTTTIDLTKHNWTLEKQFDKFLGEVDELDRAIYIKDKICIVQEAIDCLKALGKCLVKLNDRFSCVTITTDKKQTSDNILLSIDNALKSIVVHHIDYDSGYNLACIFSRFLFHFCLENDEDLIEHIKINNDKTNGRGDARKVYFNEGEEEMLKQVSAFCKENKKVGFGIDIDELLKRVED